ncbi:MAG TPA: histidine kinase [Candidatus Angelobacter sp.]
MQWKNRLLKRVLAVWLLLFPFWVGLFALGTWAAHRGSVLAGKPVAWDRVARFNFAAYADWALIITPVVLLLTWIFPLERRTLAKAILAHVVGMAGATGIDAGFGAIVHHFTYPEARPLPFGRLWQGYFLSSLTSDIWMYWGVAIIALGVSYYLQFREKEIEEAQLETQLARAQLSILKMQLQPHFLFNTLHSISALMHKDVKAADRMISSLGDLLRMSITEADVQEVTLKHELEFLDKYLEIQKIRFQGQLSVTTAMEPEMLSAVVPYLFLQPLVENAIKHGISKRTDPGTINIDVGAREGRLHLRVTNDGSPRDFMEANGTSGFGLSNMRARLQSLYGADQHLRVRHLPDHSTEAEVVIPLRMSLQEQNGHGSPARKVLEQT